MNIEFLNQRIAIRNKEIADGKNAGTQNPIYFVYSMREEFLSGHCTDRSPITNNRGMAHENLYIKKEWEEDAELFEEIPDGENEYEYEEITRIWIDDFKALFITHEAAEDYLKYQAHNLNNPYIFTHYAGYRNWEFDNIMFDERH